LKRSIRVIRAVLARTLGGVLASVPGLEAAFIASGRWFAPRSRVLGSLYWFTQDDLMRRVRTSGRRFRRLPVAGIDMYVDMTDGTGRLHYFYDDPYEPETSRAIRRLLRTGDVFLDIGAHVGYFSTLAGHIVGNTGQVVAFEPHPEAVATLRAATVVNGLSGAIEIVEAAAGNAAGTVRFFLSVDPVLSTIDPARSPARDHFTFDRSIEVRQLTVDAWLADRKDLTPRIRAIKIDVEGTEADVVEGMRGTLAACPRAVILVETDAGGVADRLLRAEGYVGSMLDVRLGGFGNYLYERTRTT
jgi:FkbM family methyltransferase